MQLEKKVVQRICIITLTLTLASFTQARAGDDFHVGAYILKKDNTHYLNIKIMNESQLSVCLEMPRTIRPEYFGFDARLVAIKNKRYLKNADYKLSTRPRSTCYDVPRLSQSEFEIPLEKYFPFDKLKGAEVCLTYSWRYLSAGKSLADDWKREDICTAVRE